MRNFKLLLGATALLSMGAMTVNATPGDITGESTSVQTRVEILKARSLANTVPLDFGRIIVDQGVNEFAVIMDSSGGETFDFINGGSAYILTQGTKGVVTGASCSQLSYPASSTKIIVTPPTGATIERAYIIDLACTDDNNGNATFNAYLNIDNASSETPVAAGIYTTSFTVTAIYPVETPSSGD